MSFLSKLARVMGFADEPAAMPSKQPIKPFAPQDNRAIDIPDTSPSKPNRIMIAADGQYHAGGYSFTTESQALDFVRRRGSAAGPANLPRPSLQPARQLDESKDPRRSNEPIQLVQTPRSEAIRSSTAVAPDRSDGIAITADGRFCVGGHSFSTEAQAQNFLKRLGRPLNPSAYEHRLATKPARALEETRPAYRNPAMAIVRPPPPMTKADKGSPLRWIAGPSRETIAGITFDVSLTYVGTRDQQAWPRNQSAIDPALPVGNKDDPEGSGLSWSPDYCSLPPETRRSYLTWLAADRPGGAAIGYVKLFFGGLERRLLLDKSKEDALSILGRIDIQDSQTM